MNSVPFLILAGGEGTRFKSVDEKISKIIYPILEKPFVFYILEKIYRFNADAEIYISLHEDMMSVKTTIEKKFSKIKFILEEKRRGTGGAVQHAFEKLNTEELIILNGDSYIDIDWTEFFMSSLANTSSICLCHAKNTKDTEGKGNVTVDQERVTSFNEKSDSKSEFVNAGIYRLLRDDISTYFKESKWSLEIDYFSKTENLMAFISQEQLFDIGTLKGLEDFKNYLR